MIAQYTCVAIQRLEGAVATDSHRLFGKLCALLEDFSFGTADGWFGMAEQAINTVYSHHSQVRWTARFEYSQAFAARLSLPTGKRRMHRWRVGALAQLYVCICIHTLAGLRSRSS